MNTSTRTKPPRWYWLVGSLALAWNLMGVAAYLGQMTMDLSALPDAQRAFYESIPTWATAAFAIAVFAGVAGSIGLLLKKRWAIPVLVVSFASVVVQVTHSLLLGNGLEVFGTSALILPLATLATGLALIGFAYLSKNRAWI